MDHENIYTLSGVKLRRANNSKLGINSLQVLKWRFLGIVRCIIGYVVDWCGAWN